MPILTLLHRRAASAAAILAALLAPSASLSFLLRSPSSPITTPPPALLQMAKSYGPRDAEILSSSNDDTNRNNIKAEFASLLSAVVASEAKPEELPSLLATNIDMILAAMNTYGLIEQVIQEDIQSCNDAQRLDQLSAGVNTIIDFVETFVQEAQSMEEAYKQLLGQIFQTISPSNNNSDSTSSSSSSYGEQALEDLLTTSATAFTPGFLRHVDGECNRIASLPTISPESAKMLEILRVIQARILEELGKGIGEGAVVLGQLLGYDEKSERLAVLDAGLAVRGLEFAQELKGLTGEALEGFRGVQGGVDPGLVRSVEEIDERIGVFIEKEEQGHFQ